MAGLKAPTLDDAAKNPDGTYNGAKALSWMSEALHPGNGVPVAEVQGMWDGLKAEKMSEGKVTTELEGQPHGGALKRSYAEEDDKPSFVDTRHTERMELVPAIYKSAHERLACELALKFDEPADVFARYGYDEEQAAALLDNAAFEVLLKRITAEIQTSGLTYKAKARAIAEDLLPEVYAMGCDPHISPAVRLSAAQWTARMAGYEPKTDKDEGKQGGGLNLSITFAGQAPVQVVAQEQPLTITQEG